MDRWETEASLGYLAEMVKKEGRQVSIEEERTAQSKCNQNLQLNSWRVEA